MPDVHGGFNLPYSELSYGSILHVEGDDCVTSASNSAGSSNGSGNTLSSVVGSSRQLSSTFQSIIPKRSNLSTRYSLKVVKATMNRGGNGKAIFNSMEQIYIDLTEKTASAVTIKSAVQEEWGDAYTVVTADGLEVRDSAGTTGKTIIHACIITLYIFIGLQFWKCGSRKFFAVLKNEIDDGSNARAKRRRVSMDHEDDVLLSLTEDVTSIKTKVQEVIQEMQASRAEVKDIIKIKHASEIPVQLQQALNDSLKCKICMAIAKPPVIFGKCCQKLLGCQACIDTWFEGNSFEKTCINCREERAITQTCLLRGMDSLFTLTRDILEEPVEIQAADGEQ